MRAFALLVALLVLPSLASAHHWSDSGTHNVSCFATATVVSVRCGVGPFCYAGIGATSGDYELTVTWTPAHPSYEHLTIEIFTTGFTADPPLTYVVGTTQSSQIATGPSPLTVSIPATAQDVHVCYEIGPSSPVFVGPPFTPQLASYVIRHV